MHIALEKYMFFKISKIRKPLNWVFFIFYQILIDTVIGQSCDISIMAVCTEYEQLGQRYLIMQFEGTDVYIPK